MNNEMNISAVDTMQKFRAYYLSLFVPISFTILQYRRIIERVTLVFTKVENAKE